MRFRRVMPVVLGSLLLAWLLLVGCAPASTPAPTQEPPMAMEPTMAMEPEHEEEGSDMGAGHAEEGDETGMEAEEHAHAEIPSEYEGLTNPFAGDSAAVAEGQQVYTTSCATCHGETGTGDGPAAAALSPSPADLSDADMMQGITDGYMFWRVSEGGAMEPFNSAMPPWKAILTEDQIWKVILYIRTLSQ